MIFCSTVCFSISVGGIIFGIGLVGGVAVTVRNWSINFLREVLLFSIFVSAL